MVHIIWALMAIIGILYAMINGTMDLVNEAIFKSAEDAVQLTIRLMSVLVFWLGIMKIAEKAHILKYLAKVFRPLIYLLFPELPKDHKAVGYILSNITANIFGLGSAATPFGLKAMEEMQKLNHYSNKASRSMITFLALNTSSLTLIPTTVIAIRMQYNSAEPTAIVGTTIVATVVSTLAAILFDRCFNYFDQKK